ncbi:MAG TPA: DUF92 domain-containing protein [Flavisolibacter sp.]|nr:DUF92 domain-containing protein [Flavisolibacter sp.]
MLSILFFILLIAGGMTFAVAGKKLTVAAAITGAVLCTSIFIGVGWTGVALMTAFFVMGTLATSWKKGAKEKIGLAQENKGRRTTGQVLANGGAGGLLGLLAILFPQQEGLFLFLIAAVFSSATADTIASELGSVYGKRFYDILSFREVQRGPDGVISVEGLIFGIAGSAIIAAIYALGEGLHATFGWIVLAGTIGNLADSYLGATLERGRRIGNDLVNFLNTAIAAIVALVLSLF